MTRLKHLIGLLIVVLAFCNIPPPLSGGVDQVDGEKAAIGTKVAIKKGLPTGRVGGGTRLYGKLKKPPTLPGGSRFMEPDYA